MMLIRWVPSVCRLVAYYANLMLISSFLGLGIGALQGKASSSRNKYFAPILFAFTILLLITQHIVLPGSNLELRFFVLGARPLGYLALITIFIMNVALFVPLGQRIGQAFDRLPALSAYQWDLLGSLAGTLAFGLFSYTRFSPIVGLTVIMALFIALAPSQEIRGILLFFSLTWGLLWWKSDRDVMWSPYYHITVSDESDPTHRPVKAPPLDLKTMTNPPIYSVSVNQDFYQTDGSINPARYKPVPIHVSGAFEQYRVPYALIQNPQDVLIAGSGGGTDAEVAVLSGGSHIDAVEIDPILIRLGRRFNASDSYASPRVHVVAEDARAFFQKTSRRYDLITFGFLDSQALFSSMSNIRLDGFVYTVESFRAAHHLLKERGVLCVSFMVAYRKWLVFKLFNMLTLATGQEPLVYMSGTHVVFCVTQQHVNAPIRMGPFERVTMRPGPTEPATDDWPYLYLSKKGIPLDYAIVIGLLCLLSLGFLKTVHRDPWNSTSFHFLFMGFGFMLLETKSIVDCSLYLGATWRVALIVISGVLGMILIANTISARRPEFNKILYVPLLLSLIALLIFPRVWVLGWPFYGRLAWTLCAVPLPILFAGLIFSGTFKNTKHASAALGANLIGATMGGFADYLGMFCGYQKLFYLVIGAYLLSMLSLSVNPIKRLQ